MSSFSTFFSELFAIRRGSLAGVFSEVESCVCPISEVGDMICSSCVKFSEWRLLHLVDRCGDTNGVDADKVVFEDTLVGDGPVEVGIADGAWISSAQISSKWLISGRGKESHSEVS